MIRPYTTADAPKLVRIHNSVFPDKQLTTFGFNDYVTNTRALKGFVWVISESAIIGYGLVAQVPGLPGIAELAGCIAPEYRRQGFGSQLLVGMLNELHISNIRQISFGVDSMDGPDALFLRRHNFFTEHEEWILRFDKMAALPEKDCLDSLRLQTFPRKTAVPLFCQIYEACFSGLPWDQPFTQKEVAETLDHADDILFLIEEGQAVGIAWTKVDSDGTGIVEPLGIVPAFQGRGYGRCLLSSAMHSLAQRRAKCIEIGAWKDNKRAIDLYLAHGFVHKKTITFLAYNLA